MIKKNTSVSNKVFIPSRLSTLKKKCATLLNAVYIHHALYRYTEQKPHYLSFTHIAYSSRQIINISHKKEVFGEKLTNMHNLFCY